MFWKTSKNSQINTRNGHPKEFCQKEKMFFKILQSSPKNIFAGVSFLIKLQAGNLLSEEADGNVM